MADRTTPVTKEGVEQSRIERQGYVWLDAEYARRADNNRDTQRREWHERCKLANVLAEERKP